ncbi:MAG: CHAT domain-containing protein [Cyanobacteria bacterium P01_D01_bin.105]
MLEKEDLCLWVAVDRLQQGDRLAIWVLRAPHPRGHVHHDRLWSAQLVQAWQEWQSLFSLRGLPQVPHIPSAYVPQFVLKDLAETPEDSNGQPTNFSSRYMQNLGIQLWRWLFEGPIKSSFEQSQGIAIGQEAPLRLRLEIRDPELIALPWEIMQPQPGSRALSLNRKILVSRTSSDVDRLEPSVLAKSLKILLVIGKDSPGEETVVGEPDSPKTAKDEGDRLQLGQEAVLLKKILEQSSDLSMRPTAQRTVEVLLQPSAAELSSAVEKGGYNVFFYAGHGVPGPDGGLLFLSDATLSGTELAQVLTRAKVKLAVFNTCWGAQPEENQQAVLPRSSLAEVLLHYGVPAVVAMRDSIADEEAISFIQVFSQALAERKPVDEAVAIARQHLLTLYHFNQPAWTLPVLYMHPNYDGALLLSEETTQINEHSNFLPRRQQAMLRNTDNPKQTWPIYSDVMRIGRKPEENDLVISEPWVSSSHAEIFHRRVTSKRPGDGLETAYFLRDNSRYGTFYLEPAGERGDQWRQVHRQETALLPGTQIRFGSQSEGQLLEFVVEEFTVDQ